jgi:uncharacterized protein (TIGR02145 family)
MKKLLFTAFATFAILSCSSDDKMPYATCSTPTCNSNVEKRIYCYIKDGSPSCSSMSSKDCKSYGGDDYGSDSTCDNYLRKMAYCLSNDGDYDCEYLTIATCNGSGGYYYGSDPTCGGYRQSSSSTQSSSSVSPNGDCDANDYKPFITIGRQTWMGKNLNCFSANSKCYNNNQANCNTYGRLYSWAGAMGINKKYNDTTYTRCTSKCKGICPDGWHIPSSDELETLIDMIDGSQLKAKSGWNSDDYYIGNGTDDYGFAALPGGYGHSDGDANFTYDEVGDTGYWWTATQESDDSDGYANYWYISYDSDYADEDDTEKYNMYSVRCLKD